VIVSVKSDCLTGPAVAATLYELADMRPHAVCFAFETKNVIQIIIGAARAFSRIYKVFADGDVIGERMERLGALGVINDQFEVSIERTTGLFDIRPSSIRSVPVERFSAGL
jgi:hypothetical protein